MTASTRGARRERTLEHELKFRLGGPREQARVRARLRELNAVQESSYDEENVRYEAHAKAQPANLRLRILDGGPGGILTAKGPARFMAGIKSREETELEVPDAAGMRDLLETIGFKVSIVYHKHRETWLLAPVTVTIDTLDFGFYSEIEGPREELAGIAEKLGLEPRHALRMSYSELARRHTNTLAGARRLA